MSSSVPVLEAGGYGRSVGGRPENGRSFTERFRGWQPRELSDQRNSSASAMPDASPLRPISHWRSGKPAMIMTLVLKTECLRQFDRLAAVGERNPWLTGDDLTDATDPRPFW
jgi:hypothetical protein